MRSEEEAKKCAVNRVPTEIIIRNLIDELETYKKALDMACEQLWNEPFSDCDNCPLKNDNEKCTTNYCGITSNDLMNYYLKKAWEEDE